MIELYWKCKSRQPREQWIQEFMQKMLNRLMTGYLRYGEMDRSQNYMTRLLMELKAYKRTGNCEHLYNIANYAFLESQCPENKKFHFDATVQSATRKEGAAL
jgi:hypothetical protein